MAKRNSILKPKLVANYNGWKLAKVKIEPGNAYNTWYLTYTKDFAGEMAVSKSVMLEEAFSFGNLARNCVIQDIQYAEEEIHAGRLLTGRFQ